MTEQQVLTALRRLAYYRVVAAQQHALEGPPDKISGTLLLALGLRESGLQNINNAAGTDRGCFQITDIYHSDWLRSQPGCPVGSWVAVEGHTAVDPGYCPRYTPALVFALSALQAGLRVAAAHDVPPADALRLAIAAYNAGSGNALRGYREGDVDKYTTGGDYSAWVIQHRTLVNHVLAQDLPHWIVAPPA